jgi:hypothetical protein
MLSTQLALASDALAIFIILGVVGLVGTLALLLPSTRRNNALLAPCIVIVTIAVSVFGVGLLTAVAYRLMGY